MSARLAGLGCIRPSGVNSNGRCGAPNDVESSHKPHRVEKVYDCNRTYIGRADPFPMAADDGQADVGALRPSVGSATEAAGPVGDNERCLALTRAAHQPAGVALGAVGLMRTAN